MKMGCYRSAGGLTFELCIPDLGLAELLFFFGSIHILVCGCYIVLLFL